MLRISALSLGLMMMASQTFAGAQPVVSAEAAASAVTGAIAAIAAATTGDATATTGGAGGMSSQAVQQAVSIVSNMPPAALNNLPPSVVPAAIQLLTQLVGNPTIPADVRANLQAQLNVLQARG